MADNSRDDDDDCGEGAGGGGKTKAIQLPGQSASVAAGGALHLNLLSTGLGAGAKLLSFKDSSGTDLYADENGKLLYLADNDKFLKLGVGLSKTDTVTYTMQDAAGHTAVGSITVTVGALPVTAQLGGKKYDVIQKYDQVNDLIFTKGGGDIVTAGDGADSVYGGRGSDMLFGEGGNDLLVAGSGGGYMDGGYGNDTLVAGSGQDILYFTDFGGQDVVIGFDPKRDVLQLPNVYFNSLADVQSAASIDAQGNVVIVIHDDHTHHPASITLVGVTSFSQLTAGDFVYVG